MEYGQGPNKPAHVYCPHRLQGAILTFIRLLWSGYWGLRYFAQTPWSDVFDFVRPRPPIFDRRHPMLSFLQINFFKNIIVEGEQLTVFDSVNRLFSQTQLPEDGIRDLVHADKPEDASDRIRRRTNVFGK